MKITLTLDNGPDVDATPLVLKTLERREVRATFFVLGEKLRHGRYLAERAHDEGHWIGNHTYNHLMPLGKSGEVGQAASEIVRTQELIGDLAHPRRLFRPVGSGGGGSIDSTLLNREALDTLTAGSYSCVLWNAIAYDWIYPTGWVERAIEQCLAQPHSLLVLHDLPTGAMTHLDRFIGLAQDAGAQFEQDFPEECLALDRGRKLDAASRITSDS